MLSPQKGTDSSQKYFLFHSIQRLTSTTIHICAVCVLCFFPPSRSVVIPFMHNSIFVTLIFHPYTAMHSVCVECIVLYGT